MRYFMIDRITELKVGESAVAVKNVTLSEDILQDHFPDYPVFPGALIIEAMAQLSGFLLEMTMNKPGKVRRALLGQVDRAKFHNMAEPGDQLIITVRIDHQMEDAAQVKCSAAVSGEKVSSALLTFVMKHLDSERIHRQRRYFYNIWTRKLDNLPEIL